MYIIRLSSFGIRTVLEFNMLIASIPWIFKFMLKVFGSFNFHSIHAGLRVNDKVSLESFVVTEQTMKTVKLFHHEWFQLAVWYYKLSKDYLLATVSTDIQWHHKELTWISITKEYIATHMYIQVDYLHSYSNKSKVFLKFIFTVKLWPSHINASLHICPSCS